MRAKCIGKSILFSMVPKNLNLLGRARYFKTLLWYEIYDRESRGKQPWPIEKCDVLSTSHHWEAGYECLHSSARLSLCFSKKINKTAAWWEHTCSLLTRYAFLVNIYDFLTWHVEHIFRIYAAIRTWSVRVGCGSCPNWNFKCHDNFRWWVCHWPHIFILPDYCQNCNLGHRQPK